MAQKPPANTVEMRDLFLLDPDIVFLNHGSFGATPKPVFKEYQSWQRKLENQPVQFLGYELGDRLSEVRSLLGRRYHTHPDNVVLIPNVTFGVNIVTRSLDLVPGDEVLTTNHEYGACLNTLKFICQEKEADLIQQRIPLSASTSDELLEHFWKRVTDKTKLIFLSHITSPTAMKLPVEVICQRARERSVLSMVDGAHAPGQIDLALDHIGADFYVGNFHKWMLAPKGSAFLYVRGECQDLIEPLIVSWGWDPDWEWASGNRFQDKLRWYGTIDPAAYLSVPAAYKFMDDYRWDEVRVACHSLLLDGLNRIHDITEMPFVYPLDERFIQQMAIAPLPELKDHRQLQKTLWEKYKIEIPIIAWDGGHYIRLSIQGYNTLNDIEILLSALEDLIPVNRK